MSTKETIYARLEALRARTGQRTRPIPPALDEAVDLALAALRERDEQIKTLKERVLTVEWTEPGRD